MKIAETPAESLYSLIDSMPIEVPRLPLVVVVSNVKPCLAPTLPNLSITQLSAIAANTGDKLIGLSCVLMPAKPGADMLILCSC